MTDFARGIILGAVVATYVLLVVVPSIRWRLHRRRVLAEANRRLDEAERRLRRGWETRRGSNPPPSAVKPPPPPCPPPMRQIIEGVRIVPQDDTQ